MGHFTDAYATAGYSLSNPRNQWSAQRADGRVAVTIWDDEIDRRTEPPLYDMRDSHPKLQLWIGRQGNKSRARHIEAALQAGRTDFDLILCKAEDPRSDTRKIKSARHWFERVGRIRAGSFDPVAGTFVMELPLARP